MKYFYLFGLPFLAGLIFTSAQAWLDRRLGLMDQPDEQRKLHQSPVPTAGGLSVMAAHLLGMIVAVPYFLHDWSLSRGRAAGMMLGGLLLCAVGLWDDRRRMGPWSKLAFQAAAGLTLWLSGYGVAAITHPFGDQIGLGWLSLPATVIWVLVVTNAINLIDGVDGLAAGIVMISLGTLMAVSYRAGEMDVIFYAGPLLAALAGFWIFNLPPARIFLGDSGSLFLGYCLAAFSLMENRKGATAMSLLVPIVAMGVPLLDTCLAFFRRSANGCHPFKPDRLHLHHRLLRLGMTPRQVLFAFLYASIYLGFSALLLSMLPKAYLAIMILIMAVGVVAGMGFLRFLEGRLCGPDRPNDQRGVSP